MRFQATVSDSRPLERLAAGVAHSFNNLLTVIGGFSTLELSRLPPDSELAQSLKMIAEAADRGAQMANQLLAYSTQQIVYPRKFDLNDHLLGLIPKWQGLAGREIEVCLELGAALPPAVADVDLFDQMLTELVTNARDATLGPGIVVVTSSLEDVAADRVPAAAKEARAGRYFRITVEDTGIGMDESVVEHLFEPIFRDKEAARGIGMGLAAAQGCARQHGGWIEVETGPGEGSAFHVFLPVKD